MDDFGAGACSLGKLRHLAVDILKVERGLVQDLGEPKSRAVVSAIVRLAQELQLTVVAEGIETAEQLARLIELGCPLGQGYLLGRPAQAAAAEQLLIAQAAKGIAAPRASGRLTALR